MISVVIPTYRRHRANEGGYFRRLEWLVQSCLKQGPLEVIVVPNFDDRELGKLSASVKVAKPSGLGVNRARNTGIRLATGDILLFLDDDCELPTPDFALKLERFLKATPDIAGVGGAYLNPAGAPFLVRGYHAMTRAWIDRGRTKWDARGFWKCGNLLGGASAYRREVFDSGLWFDESVLTGGDETEFQRRLCDRGYELAFCPELSVVHHASRDVADHVLRAWRQGWNDGKLGLTRTREVTPAMPRDSHSTYLATYLAGHYLLMSGARQLARARSKLPL